MYLFLCSCPEEHAGVIAEALVGEQLAACVHLLPAGISIYRWEGELCRDREVTLILKIADTQAEDARERILELHPYEVPELIALSVDEARSFEGYLQWVRESPRPSGEG